MTQAQANSESSLCADRACDNLEHKHSWMITLKRESGLYIVDNTFTFRTIAEVFQVLHSRLYNTTRKLQVTHEPSVRGYQGPQEYQNMLPIKLDFSGYRL